MKLKKLAWKKVPPAKVVGSTWETVATQFDDLELNVDSLEGFFVAQETGSGGGGGGGGGAKKKPAAPTVVSLLDPKRANHVSIAMSRLKKEPEEVFEAILGLDDSMFTIDELESLMSIVPTAEDLGPLKEFSGDVSKLDKPEKFFILFLELPNVASRVRTWLFVRTFDESVHAILPKIGTIKRTFRQIRMGKNFNKLLALVLGLGNYLNGGTFNGRAYGFELNILLRLADTKASSKPGFTLLHYLYTLVDEKHRDILDWYSDFRDLDDAVSISAKNLEEDMKILRDGVAEAEAEMLVVQDLLSVPEGESLDEGMDRRFGRYQTRLQHFLAGAKDKVHVAQEEMSELAEKFDDVAAAFGLNAASLVEAMATDTNNPPTAQEALFQLLTEFHKMWEQAKADVIRDRETSARAAAASVGGKKKSRRAGAGAAPRGRSGVKGLLAAAKDGNADEQRQDIRRAQSIRRASMKPGEGAEASDNVNTLLDLLDTLKAQA